MTAALALADAGRVDEATAALERVVAHHARHADAMHELGLLHAHAGRIERALSCLRAAAEIEPGNARYHFNLGLLLQQCGRARESVVHCERAVALAPAEPYPLHALAAASRAAGELEAAAAALGKIVAMRPGDADAHNVLGLTLLDQGKIDEAIEAFRRAMSHRPGHAAAHSNLLLAMNYAEGLSPQEVRAAHDAFGRAFAPPGGVRARVARAPAAADGRLRVGYLSPDLKNHPVGHFLYPVLARHDRARFCVTCYSDAPASDGITQQLRRLPERWRDVAGLDDEQLAAAVERDGIDVLVELAGHTNRNRLALLARRRLAPVQVTYLGYPNTTGVASIDFRITDAIADPPGALADAQHAERLIRLEGGPFFAAVKVAEAPEVGPLPAAARGGRVTFAVISNFAKVRPPAIRRWAEILRAVPSAELLVVARAMDDHATRARLESALCAQGVEPNRVTCRGWGPLQEFLQLLNDRVDVVLDTWPFNGHTTTCHALLMGAAVVTLAGDTHRSRMGASILAHAGLPELIADSEEAYVRIASDLARDVPRLSELRAGLRARVYASPIFDTTGFTRRLEAAYAAIARV